MARKKIINRTHKNPASDGIDLNAEVGGDLLGMSGGKTNPSLKAFEDIDETDPEKVGGSVAAIEATLKYVDKILKEDDEDLDVDDEDMDDEDLDDMEADEPVDDDDVDFEDDSDTGFGDDGDDLDDEDLDECGLMEGDEGLDDDLPEDDEDLDLDTDEDMDDEDLPANDGEDDLDVEDSDDEDLAEGFMYFEGDEGLDDTEVVSTEPDEDLDMEDDDMGEDNVTGAISVDLPEDIDPNDVEVTVGDSTYVPDIDSAEDVDDMGDEDLDMEDDEDFDEDMPEDDDMDDVSESTYNIYQDQSPYDEDDDPEIDDVTDDEDEDLDMEDDDVDLEDNDIEDEDDDTLDVSEAAVMRALNNILYEDERSDSSLTSDPSCSTGDDPIDCECDIDDSEDRESGLSGDEGEVTDADIPIEKGTIQPEEAAELRWMTKKLRGIMEGDEDSHKEDGKLSAEPLDSDAEDIIDDIGDSLEDDGPLTDIGDGAVEDGETTLGSPDEVEDIEDGDIELTSSNGEGIEDDELDDDETHLTDNYYKVMTAINEACKKCGKKGNKKAAVKKAVKAALAKKKKDKKFKMVKEGVDAYPEMSGVADYVGNKNFGSVNTKATATAKKGADELQNKTLENTVLGNFNKSEMNSVLKSLNNAFGTGSTTVSKEIRDSNVVSEVSVPTQALPIAENATWDGVNAGKLLVETAYKSESKVNTNLLKMTHLYWLNEGTDPSDYKFPIASMVEGKAQIIPEAINEATQLFASPSFILRFSETALKKIRNVLDFYNEKMGKKSPWKSNNQIQVSEAAKITMIDRTSYNPYAVLKRLSEQENAKKLINLRG